MTKPTMYTVTVSMVELDELGNIKDRVYEIRMDRMGDYSSIDGYAESAVEYIEEGMYFNDEQLRPGLEEADE
jgi:hypothetical protein